MTDVSFRELMDSRGGRVEYAFGVAGYPWLVCTSKDLANALNSGSYAAQQALTRMLGTNTEAGVAGFFAYYAEVFAGLETPGKTTWKVDEGKGLSGGEFTIEVTDQTLGITWAHAPAPFEGIEGIHRVAQPYNDTSIGWGFLHSNFERDDGTIQIIEQNGSKIKDRVDALGANEHVLLWVNQECFAVSAAGLGDGILTLTVANDGAARGLFMSGEADHWTEYYADTNPIVSDVPVSIIDKPCYVWAIGLDQEEMCYQLLEDAFMEDVGTAEWTTLWTATLSKEIGAPYEQAKSLRATDTIGQAANGFAQQAIPSAAQDSGWIHRLTGWMRGDGGAGIPYIGNGGDPLWTGTSSTAWQAFDIHFEPISRWISFRNSNDQIGSWIEADGLTLTQATKPPFDGTATEPPRIAVQPQKIMWGKVSPSIKFTKGKTSIRCLNPFTQLDNEITLPQFHGKLARYVFSRSPSSIATVANALTNKASPHLVLHEWDGDTWETTTIWLCAAGDNISYNTVDDVLDALEEELGNCEYGETTQTSGAAGSYVTTIYHYSIVNGKLYQYVRPAGGPAVDRHHLTNISGPLAWLFNLGYCRQHMWDTKNLLLGGGSQPLFYSSTSCGLDNDGVANLAYGLEMFMICRDGSSSGAQPGHSLEPHKAWITKYLYQWQWDETDYEGTWGNWQPGRRDRFPIAGGNLYFRKDVDLDNVANGEDVTLGDASDYNYVPRFCKTTIGTKDETADGYPHFSTTHLEAINDSPFVVGTGLYYVPAIEGTLPPSTVLQDQEIGGFFSDADASDNAKSIYKIEKGDDPWEVSQTYDGKADTFSGIIRGLLGDSGSAYMDIAPNQQASHIVGFRDNADFDSCIDWAELDDKYDGGIINGQRWQLDLGGTFNILELLTEEIKFAGLAPVWEWDDTTYQFMMRFREIGPFNISRATEEGRFLTESMIKYGTVQTEEQSDTWLYNKLTVSFNSRVGKYYAKIPIEINSANAANRAKSKEMSIKSAVSKIRGLGNLPEGKFKNLIAHFGAILRALAVPAPVFKAQTSLGSIVNHAVGREMLITDRSGYIPYTHARGLNETPGLCTEISIDPRRGACTVKARIAQDYVYGWAPAASCEANDSVKDGVVNGESQVTLSCQVHEFTPSSYRPDVMYFKCYDWNKSTNEYQTRSCSCGEYLIQLVRADIKLTAAAHTLDYYVRSVSVDGTMVVYSKTAGDYTNFDVTKPWVAIFGAWDDVETCQQKYIYFADQAGFLGAGDDLAMRWT